MTHARLLSLSPVALLLACTAPEPAPVAKVVPTAPPTVTPPPTPPTVTPPTVTPPPPTAGGGLPWETLKDGVVPRALAQQVTVAELEPPILVRVSKCNVLRPGGDCNYGGTEILGFSAKGVALSYTPESGHPEIWPVVGEVVGLDGTSRERKTITQTGELEGRAYTAAHLKGWKWFAAIAKAGYTAPRPLLWAQGMTGGDDFPYEPLAFLKAPLAGWMLYIAPDGEQMVVQLVAPDNQRTYRLASMPFETADRCFDEDGSVVACPTPHRYQKANIDVLALDPTNEHLVVIYTLLNPDGGVHRSRWAVYKLPPEVRPTP